GVRNQLADMLDTLIAEPDSIAPYLVTMKAAHIRALCEVLYEAGMQHIPDTHHPTLLILWNNRENDTITYRYGDAFLFFGSIKSMNQHQGVVPRFVALTPEIETWTHGASGEHVQRTQWHVQVDYNHIASVSES